MPPRRKENEFQVGSPSFLVLVVWEEGDRDRENRLRNICSDLPSGQSSGGGVSVLNGLKGQSEVDGL